MSTRRTFPSPVSESEAAKAEAIVVTPEPFAQLVTATNLGLWVKLLISKYEMSRSRKASENGRSASDKCESGYTECATDAASVSSSWDTECPLLELVSPLRGAGCVP